MSAYDVLKTKWRLRQDTDTMVFGATRDEAIAKIQNLAKAVRFLPVPLNLLCQLVEQEKIKMLRNFI